MSEKRFTTKNIICSNYCVWDNNDKPYGNDEVAVLLNEQQATITALNEKIEQRNGLLDKIEKALGEPIEEWLLGVKYR